jgi:hypothetical protein
MASGPETAPPRFIRDIPPHYSCLVLQRTSPDLLGRCRASEPSSKSILNSALLVSIPDRAHPAPICVFTYTSLAVDVAGTGFASRTRGASF